MKFKMRRQCVNSSKNIRLNEGHVQRLCYSTAQCHNNNNNNNNNNENFINLLIYMYKQL